jgi:hypothetical protein
VRVTGNRILRIALLLLCLAASTTQNWVAQLHFHGELVSAVATSPLATHSVAGDEPTPGVPGHPEGQCLLCHVAGHGVGVPLARAVPEYAAPLFAFVRVAAVDRPQPLSSTASHHWSSRGPPHA